MNIKCVKEADRFHFLRGKMVYHDWEKCVGDFKYHLTFAFCRVNMRYYLFGKQLPFGSSIFIREKINWYDVVKGTVWYVPPLELRLVEVKFHFSSPETEKLISFSMSASDKNPRCIPSLLDGRIIEFDTAFTNTQKLSDGAETWAGEIYPEQNRGFNIVGERQPVPEAAEKPHMF